MAISNSTITTTGDNIFVCPGTPVTDPQEYAVTCMFFCNVSASSSSLNVYVIPNGGSVTATSKIVNSLTIPAGETFSFDTEKLILASGDRVHAVASANSTLVSTVSVMRVA